MVEKCSPIANTHCYISARFVWESYEMYDIYSKHFLRLALTLLRSSVNRECLRQYQRDNSMRTTHHTQYVYDTRLIKRPLRMQPILFYDYFHIVDLNESSNDKIDCDFAIFCYLQFGKFEIWIV